MAPEPTMPMPSGGAVEVLMGPDDRRLGSPGRAYPGPPAQAAPGGRDTMGRMTDDELVLGVPRDLLMAEGGWRGILHGDLDRYLALIADRGTYRRRADCEHDPSWKQVIPYLVVRDRGSLFLMKRTRAGADERLHERWS